MRWGMTIDLDRCNGCEACVVACRAENNVPTVGQEDCEKGRMMSWMRVERYWEGEFPDVKARFMPVLCQQCDEAPCEPVCPVYATYHSADGLNIQVHNRCIGTRFCANACPYTARAFNWFDYKWDAPLEQQLNPEVSVRERGMMEKCTFCVQRIRGAQIKAEDGKTTVKDGDVQPACAQSCPSEAIVFGDLDDPNSKASRTAASARAFRLMEDLGTKPKVIYLKPVDWNTSREKESSL